GHLGGVRTVDRLDLRVRMRRADEIDVGLARTIDVVGILALAGDEPEVFLAADSRADPGSAHRVSSLGNRFDELLLCLFGQLPYAIAFAPAAIDFTMLW